MVWQTLQFVVDAQFCSLQSPFARTMSEWQFRQIWFGSLAAPVAPEYPPELFGFACLEYVMPVSSGGSMPVSDTLVSLLWVIFCPVGAESLL
ncbi:Uncharacterised protein [uncultured archaeon]|nr:Uncharacterised protein [uncultured archaeon]